MSWIRVGMICIGPRKWRREGSVVVKAIAG